VSILQVVLSLLSAVVALWLLVLIVRNRLPGDLTFCGLAVLEAGLLVQLVLGLVRVFGAHDHVSVPTYVGYLVGALVILPIGFLWSAGERTRSGTTVLLVAVVALPVLFLRLHDIWAAAHV
jgi:threonine/homoserine efflux transporter RhtA